MAILKTSQQIRNTITRTDHAQWVKNGHEFECIRSSAMPRLPYVATYDKRSLRLDTIVVSHDPHCDVLALAEQQRSDTARASVLRMEDATLSALAPGSTLYQYLPEISATPTSSGAFLTTRVYNLGVLLSNGYVGIEELVEIGSMGSRVGRRCRLVVLIGLDYLSSSRALTRAFKCRGWRAPSR